MKQASTSKFFNFLLKGCLVLYFTAFVLGLLFFYSGWDGYTHFGRLALAASAVFTGLVIVEVLGAEDLRFTTKAVWIASFLLFQIFAGMAYYFVDRNDIHQRQLNAA